jgi:fructokinase
VILVIGEILFDIFGTERRLGGAPFNFAFHLSQFGFPVHFISRIGDDALGQEILAKLSAANFNLENIQIDRTRNTGTVEVQLDDANSPRFQILPDVAYDFIQFDRRAHMPLLSQAKLIYFGSLAQRSVNGFENIQALLSQKQPDTCCLYDINLRPQGYNKAVIAQSLKNADILKINDSELETIKNMLGFKNQDHAFKKLLIDRYALSAIALTRGASGSQWITREETLKAKTVAPFQVVDSVGAGDAYASMLAAGLLQGWPIKNMLACASQFAARICEIQGAIPDFPTFYEPFQAMMQNGGKYAGS